ncbi:MAG: cob(I)yrinic acid a,c-diamide adenosyltransferase [Chloroflexota bacterium]|nr:cob(I)yrinic acid a,c-diamide adenosyltransferase [Chloroflexota bacterium]
MLSSKPKEWQPPAQPEEERGLVEVFTGNGKGKTSAALGVMLRAVGHGLRVFFVFFMKGEYPYGEREAMACLPNLTFARFGQLEFCDPREVKEAEKAEARRALQAAREAMLSGQYDLVVLDEMNVATSWKLVDEEEVVKLIQDTPEKVNLILTGRYAPERFLELADLVTEMKEIKHPFKKGIKARRGIDY